jgi:RHS repeat-associated protein
MKRLIVLFLALLSLPAFSQATNPLAESKRFIRGFIGDPSYQSFVIPLDSQKGVELDPIGSNPAKFGGATGGDLPWFLRIQKEVRRHTMPDPPTLDYGLEFENPQVAFGSSGGGTPLYTGQVYNFGIYGGGWAEGTGMETPYDLIVWAYPKGSFANGAQNVFPVVPGTPIKFPRRGSGTNWSPEWADFVAKGHRYETQIPSYGLELTVKLLDDPQDKFPISETWGVGVEAPCILSIKASNQDYYFVVETYARHKLGTGWKPSAAIVNTGTHTISARPNTLMALNFEESPAWRSTFISRPHFDGEPLPPEYEGKSLEELQQVSAPVTKQFGNPVAAHSALDDASPELRKHPSLNQLVADLKQDPVAIANYVLNEIELTDAIAYNDNGDVTEVSINAGGLNRGALATYLEGQGSPVEQSALLVYLLRQAGYPAVYVFPPRNGMKMLDTRMSALLRMQFKGFKNPLGQENLPHLIPVNYPWVAVSVPDPAPGEPDRKKWVHLFPWLKDTEIKEGLDLVDYMPANYRTGIQWTNRYLQADTAILSLGDVSEGVDTLFSKFVANQLGQNHPSLSIDDFGMKIRDRKHFYDRLEDFPQPWDVSEATAPMTIRNRLGDTPTMFDTVSIEVWNDRDSDGQWDSGETRIQTGEMFSMDIHNRRIVLNFEKTGTDKHNMILTMSPYRPGEDDDGAFGTSDSTWMKKHRVSVSIPADLINHKDYNIKCRIVHSRQRALPGSFVPGNRWNNPFGFISERVVDTVTTLRKGGTAAICFNFGRVTQKMVEVHAREFWAEEKRLKQGGGSGDDGIFQGNTAFIMGMSYYQRLSRSNRMFADLHKVRTVSDFAYGFARLDARYNPNGTLINNGEIDLIQPILDISHRWLGYAGNATLRPDQENTVISSQADFISLAIVSGSAEEHRAINSFFKKSDAVSTVKLLHLAKAAGLAPVEVNETNITAAGNTIYGDKSLSAWFGSSWSSVSAGFATGGVWTRHQTALITPGPVSGAGGAYRGLAAFILTPQGATAMITPGLNGGFGSYVPNYSFSPPNYSNISLSIGANFTPSISYSPPAAMLSILAPPSYSSWSAPTYSSYGTSNYFAEDSYTNSWLSSSSNSLLGGSSWSGSNYSSQYSSALNFTFNSGYVGNSSLFSDFVSLVSDPVNALTGEFYIDTVDLTLPGPMPLEIRRNYSSHNLASGQFGYGWKFAYVPYLVVAKKDSDDEGILYAAEQDGSVIAYTKQSANLWKPIHDDNPHLKNVSGEKLGGAANHLNAKIVRTTSGEDTWFALTGPDGSIRTFRERSFPVDNSGNFDRERPYLDKWEDTNGNRLTFSFYDDAYYGTGNPKGPEYGELRRIESRNGNFLGFNYDSAGRVVEAFARDGRRLYYQYDEYGDLIKVTRPDATEISYEYKPGTAEADGKNEVISQHLLERELKPDGRILKNIYDADRRVTEQWATVGPNMVPVKNAAFAYAHTSTEGDPMTGNTIITFWQDAATTATTRYDYSGGMITKITDPLAQEENQIWYQPGDTSPGAYPRSLKQVTDKRGLVTVFKYDSRGNLSEKTVTGMLTGDQALTSQTATTTYVFNALDLPEQVITPGQHKTVVKYLDSARPRQPTAVERWEGATLVAIGTNTYYDVVSGAVGSYGLLQQQKKAATSVDESVETFTHTKEGFLTSSTRTSGTADPAIVMNYRHNLRGELVEETDAIGRKSTFFFDDMGRKTGHERRDESNILVWWNFDYYNANGEHEWSDGPRYNPEDYVWRKYDGGGRLSEEIRWRSKGKADGTGVETPVGDELHATSFFKNDYFGNVVEISDARRNASKMRHDALGQLLEKWSYEGPVTGTLLSHEVFEYEPGGEVKRHLNPLGGETKKFFTHTGKIRRQENPDGSILEWRYHLDGRIQRETLSNNTYWETTYNDPASTITRTFHKADHSVIGSEVTVFDLRGNVISHTDLEGNTFTGTFDDLDRPKTVTGPAATASSARQTVTYSYDNSGKVTTVTDGLSRSTVTTKDALGRTISVNVNDGERVTSTAYSADHHKTTTTSGTVPGAIVTESWTDNADKPLIVRQSNGAFTLSTYDNGGLLLSRRDEIGQVSKFTFDALGRPKTQTTPDNATTTLLHDGAGNLTERQMPGGGVWKALFDTAGRMTSQHLADGGSLTRQFSYEYYPSGNSWVGKLKKSTDPRSVETTVAYDDFLRVNLEISTGPLPEHAVTRQFDHDRRGLLKQVIQNYGNPATGPPSTVNRTFDGYGQIISEETLLAGKIVSSLTQKWDAAGNRLQLDGGNSRALTYTHDAAGSLTGILDWNANAYNFPRGNNGLLVSRSNPWRTQTITLRDHAGRIKTLTTTAGAATPLVETVNWRNDSKVDDYTATRSGAGAFSETRDYGYSDRGQLTSETYAPAAGQTATLNYGFDPSKRNIRTSAMVGTGAPSQWDIHATNVNGFARVTTEASNAEPITYLATGVAFGAASVDLSLNGVNLGRASHGGWQGTGEWSRQLRLAPGGHTLVATARHPSGQHNPTASHTFNANIAAQTVTSAFDVSGNVTTRTFSGGRVQTLTWDALGRLVKVTERDGNNHGFDWTAAYDGLGRRIESNHTGIAAGTALPGATRIESTYDPEVEFLEIATRINGIRTWKVYGPDLDGSFGGLQGTGGLEATIQQTGNIATAVISDFFGNGAATIRGGSIVWNPVRSSGYGALPGYFAVPPNEGAGIAEVTGWRGKTIDPTGFYYLGARYYEPTGGRFLSADPMGHGASISLYDYANGDPVNQLDPDGRIGRGIASGYSAVSSAIRDMTGFVGGHAAGYLQSTLSGSFTSYQWSSNGPSAMGMQMWNQTVSTVQRVVTPLAIVGGPIGWVAGGISAATSFAQGDISSAAFVGLGSIARYSSSISSSSRVMSGGVSGGFMPTANSAVLNASRGIPKTGVARFDKLAAESPHFDRTISAIKGRGFNVRESPLGASNPAFIKPGNRTFYYDPKHMTYLDLRHEINHLQQFKQTGSMQIGGGRGARLEFGSYMFEGSLGARHGFAGNYMNYLENQLSGYGSMFMKP